MGWAPPTFWGKSRGDEVAGGLYLEIAFKYKVKQSKTGKFPSNDNWLAQSILKRKFPSIDKPLRIEAPQKGPLKNISPGAYFGILRYFAVGMAIFPLTH